MVQEGRSRSAIIVAAGLHILHREQIVARRVPESQPVP
jgi:hypothetical protein